MHRVTPQGPTVIAFAQIFIEHTKPRILKHACSLLLRWMSGLVLLTSAMNLWAVPFTYVADSQYRAEPNEFSVIEMTGYSVLSTHTLRQGSNGMPVDLVANPATGKIFIEKGDGLSIFDPARNAVTAHIPIAGLRSREDDYDDGIFTEYTGRQTLAVSPDGSTAYLLGVGKVIVVDIIKKIVSDTIEVDLSAATLITDREGEAVYVGNTGFSRRVRLGPPSITVIDTALKEIDDTILLPTFSPLRMAVTPDDGQLYVVGYELGNGDYKANRYAVVDLNAGTFSIRKMPVPADVPNAFSLMSLLFNQNGDRVYFGTWSYGTSGSGMPVFEVDTQTGKVLRTLHVPLGVGPPTNADNHYMPRLAGSFAGGKFRLVVFTAENAHHVPANPPRRAVFLDVQNDKVLKDVKFTLPNYGKDTYVVGDVLDDAPAAPVGLQRGVSADKPKRAAVIKAH